MFRSVQFLNMDAKGRLAVPARHREALLEKCDGRIVITIDTQSTCLWLYPLPEWERVQGEIQALPSLDPAIKRFKRLVLGYATDLELDKNGRFLLPAPLRECARLDKKLAMVGQGNKFELWAEDLWAAERDESLSLRDTDTELPVALSTVNF